MSAPTVAEDVELAAEALADGLNPMDLLALYKAVSGGGVSLAALDHAGTLDNDLASLLRVGAVLQKVLKSGERATAIAALDAALAKL